MNKLAAVFLTSILLLLCSRSVKGQKNLLLNGGFEDVNTCTEYNSGCGVEAWFYMKDVKAQMLAPETNQALLGTNSFGIFFNWLGYTGFSPVIGTLLPCRLQAGSQYIFKGMISAKLNPKLILTPGICVGNKFYVPKRIFSKDMKPDSILSLTKIQQTDLFLFEYRFTAEGNERYLTFGTYICEDTVAGKRALIGTQTVSLLLDSFQLIPANEKETRCLSFEINKLTIYDYNYRHKEMDYSLYGKGELAIRLNEADSNFMTMTREPVSPVFKTDTLVLGDVLFDFNKAQLKAEALNILKDYFSDHKLIDSISIEGHTDSIGSDKSNLELSRRRCQSVKDWLVLNQVAVENLSIHPFGRSRPIATNKTSQGRALNRRVEMIIFQRKEL